MFILKGSNIVPDPRYLTIPEFKALWDRDRTEGKGRALDELKFVYHVCDVNSLYRKKATGQELFDLVAIDFVRKYPNFNNNDELIKDAIVKYVSMQDTIAMKDFKAIQRGMAHVQTMCNTFIIPDTLEQMSKLELGERYLKLVSSYEKSVEAMSNIYDRICKQMSDNKQGDSVDTKTRATGREIKRANERINDISADSEAE